jgi:hypothetical protein
MAENFGDGNNPMTEELLVGIKGLGLPTSLV